MPSTKPAEVESFALMSNGHVFLYDHWGRETEVDTIIDALELLRLREAKSDDEAATSLVPGGRG